MNIILDGMGGDHAPEAMVEGAVQAANELSREYRICIVGDQELIQKELDQYTFDPDQIVIRHASQKIEMDEAPVKAVRTKKDASMVVGINMVKHGEGDVFISADQIGRASCRERV